MSLRDLIAAAGEEVLSLRALGAANASAESLALAQRARRRFLYATIICLFLVGICWALAYVLRGQSGAQMAAYGGYAGLAGALMSALGWAYAWAGLGKTGPRSGRDA